MTGVLTRRRNVDTDRGMTWTHREETAIGKPRRGACSRAFPHRPQKEQVLLTPWPWTSGVETTQSVVVCYGNPRKLIQKVSGDWRWWLFPRICHLPWRLPLSPQPLLPHITLRWGTEHFEAPSWGPCHPPTSFSFPPWSLGFLVSVCLGCLHSMLTWILAPTLLLMTYYSVWWSHVKVSKFYKVKYINLFFL